MAAWELSAPRVKVSEKNFCGFMITHLKRYRGYKSNPDLMPICPVVLVDATPRERYAECF